MCGGVYPLAPYYFYLDPGIVVASVSNNLTMMTEWLLGFIEFPAAEGQMSKQDEKKREVSVPLPVCYKALMHGKVGCLLTSRVTGLPPVVYLSTSVVHVAQVTLMEGVRSSCSRIVTSAHCQLSHSQDWHTSCSSEWHTRIGSSMSDGPYPLDHEDQSGPPRCPVGVMRQVKRGERELVLKQFYLQPAARR